MKHFFFAAALAVPFFLFTAVATAEETKKLKDEAELSYVETGGNTELTSFSAKNLLTWQASDDIMLEWLLAALYGESNDDKIAERYATDLKFQYSFTERLYALVHGGWAKDEFAGIENRYYVGPALGLQVLTGPTHLLQTEAGVDYVKEEYTDDSDDDFPRGRLFAKYEFVLTEKTRFSQSGEYLHDFEDGDQYQVNSETAVITALSDALSLKTSYVVAYDNDPIPEDLEKTDTMLAVTLVVNF